MPNTLADLKPQSLWDHFAQIAAIPRPSKKEERIAAHVMTLARGASLEAQQDSLGNIIVRKPASPGKEGSPMVALQSHLDMVCEKNRDVPHDFDRDGIQLVQSNGYIKAKGTTLGSDNGIGVAAALSVMLNPSLVHGPLEFLFTLDEETGLTGANGLQPGFVKSKILLNLDSEEEGSLYVGCAGGRDTILRLAIKRDDAPPGFLPIVISVGGLRGGHSGVDIHVGRANALKLLGRTLGDLSRNMEIHLAYIEGGSKRNAIPREAEALVYADPAAQRPMQDRLTYLTELYRSEYTSVDSEVLVRGTAATGRQKERVLSRADRDRVICLLSTLPHGVIAMSGDLPGLVETSTNVATIETSEDTITVGTSQRSSVGSALEDMVRVVQSMGMIAGAKVETTDGYPGWKPNMSSLALKVARQTYLELFGKEPAIKAIHAGLECGIIGERYPGIDMVSFGPTIEGPHSPDERVEIASVQKFWDLLAGVLKNLAAVSH